ncbi:glycosyltransferase family 2 protein [Galbitalea soli]|uniref:Glycosyltransferase n=1 Tax=Galbitalea soli TaxID=1268042 RepID=A0A7C9TT13_9MICO|nr:cellulose synthase catalytic subunit [Galbitalea soli]NEM92082.1 glycosyltransferase [Galbitalea soli]NYJ31966.1 cellulose synthase (UDP-forming) [Galbitalea soli]
MSTIGKERPYSGPRRGEVNPLARRVENSAVHSPTLFLFVIIATIGVLAYTAFLFNPSNRGDWLPYALVITAEVILVAQALVSMWTILSGGHDPRTFTFHHAQERLFDAEQVESNRLESSPRDWGMYLNDRIVGVDVFITVYGESLETIAKTASAALAMRGAHTTWVLDDGGSDAVRDLCADLGVRYVRRLTSNGAKAGNVNHGLTVSSGEFFAIFDADFVPHEDFLYETVPFFIDDNVAFVQTPQTYGNMHNLVSRGAGFMQSVFYRFIQPGRNRFNAAFCVGTNVIFRRTAIEEVGGMCTDSKSEDVWTSLRLHEKGWRSVYIPVTLAVGDAPETIEAYTKQQMRWASGGFEILMQRNPLSPRTKLTMDQRLQYFVTATHYLVGITPLLLLLVPPLEIYFDLRPVNLTVTWTTWLLFYLGFYGLQVLLAFHTMGSFRPETFIMAAVSFPIYIAAFVNVFAGKEQKWHVTGAKGKHSSPFNFIIPQVLTFAFLFLTSLVAVVKDYGHQTVTLATAWNVTNTVILGVFVVTAFHESHLARIAEKPRPTVYPTFGRNATLHTRRTAGTAAPAPAYRTPVAATPARAAAPTASALLQAMPAPSGPPVRRPAPAERIAS